MLKNMMFLLAAIFSLSTATNVFAMEDEKSTSEEATSAETSHETADNTEEAHADQA